MWRVIEITNATLYLCLCSHDHLRAVVKSGGIWKDPSRFIKPPTL